MKQDRKEKAKVFDKLLVTLRLRIGKKPLDDDNDVDDKKKSFFF